MGAVDLGSDKPQKKKGGLRRPKRRISIRLDMTPMVDIAFLLLIFYMVSTVFAEPQAMEINLPPSKEEQETRQSKVLTIRVAADNDMFWNIGDADPQPILLADLPKLLQDKVQEIAGLITLVKINKGARYSKMVEILDRIEVVEYRMRQAQLAAKARGQRPQDEPEYSFTFSLGPWTRLDTKLISKVTGEEDASPEDSGEN